MPPGKASHRSDESEVYAHVDPLTCKSGSISDNTRELRLSAVQGCSGRSSLFAADEGTADVFLLFLFWSPSMRWRTGESDTHGDTSGEDGSESGESMRIPSSAVPKLSAMHGRMADNARS